ncbi:hypothetical protein M3J09_013850 [Ascochyta lentis]
MCCYLPLDRIVLVVLIALKVREVCNAILVAQNRSWAVALQVSNRVRNHLSLRTVQVAVFAFVLFLYYVISKSDSSPYGTVNALHHVAFKANTSILVLIYSCIECVALAVLMLGHFCVWLCKQLIDSHDMMADICEGNDVWSTELSLWIVGLLCLLCVAAALYAVIGTCYAIAKCIKGWTFNKLSAKELPLTQPSSLKDTDVFSTGGVTHSVVTGASGSGRKTIPTPATNERPTVPSLDAVKPALGLHRPVSIDHNKTSHPVTHRYEANKLDESPVHSTQSSAIETRGNSTPSSPASWSTPVIPSLQPSGIKEDQVTFNETDSRETETHEAMQPNDASPVQAKSKSERKKDRQQKRRLKKKQQKQAEKAAKEETAKMD